MSFTSTDSFEVDLLIEDDDIDINPFWSSEDEDEDEDDNTVQRNKENQNKISKEPMEHESNEKLTKESFKIDNDSGIVLSDTKDTVDTIIIKKVYEKENNSAIGIQVENNKDESETRSRFLSGGSNEKQNNKINSTQDKGGKVVKEDNLCRERSKQKSESSALPSLVRLWSKKKALQKTQSCPNNTKKLHWLDAIVKSKQMEDPWEKFEIIESCPTERAKRFRYNALKKKWFQDEVLVKMQDTPFGRGAMRECFRMKKLSTLVHSNDWAHAGNIVAKRYIDSDVLAKTYFDDVKLQMDAKLWAEEYNRHHPPKKVDIIQVGLLKMIDRESAPMFHIEHFVEGKYVKYNSNSGFVLKEENETVRSTPQAFSHFTFERSGHQMIVVDIQGVGDLYTDPQIHTAFCDEYGEANLGTKGMALFFASHECTQICEDLNLEKFDLSEKELLRLKDIGSRSSTTTDVKHADIDSPGEKMTPMFDLVERLISTSSEDSIDETLDEPISEPVSRSHSGLTTPKFGYPLRLLSNRQRLFSEAESVNNSEEELNAHDNYFVNHIKKVSCIEDDVACRMLSSDTIARRLEALSNFEEQQSSILSQVHYDLATYNYLGRFTENIPDMFSTIYHLEKAALVGCMKANKILALKYSRLSTEEFSELEIKENLDNAMDCFIEAATRGDRDSMIRTAEAFYTGMNLGTKRSLSWTEALKWYEAALNQRTEETSVFNSNPRYEINARMAEIWLQGGHGVEKDPSYAGELYSNAAEDAMNCGKGKLSNKYYMLAEEAWAEVEE